MNQTKKKVLIVALAACLLALVSVGTLAWFTAEDEVTNQFHVAGSEDNDPDKVFSVDVWERSEPQKDEKLDKIIFKDILPGDNLYKEVNIENTGSYDQYIRATVTVTDASVWVDILGEVFFPLNELATDLNPDFVVDRIVYNADDDTMTYELYYNTTLPFANGDVVTLFTNVHIAEEMDRFQAAELSGSFNINVVATAVQTENVGDTAKEAFKTVGMHKESGNFLVATTDAGAERLEAVLTGGQDTEYIYLDTDEEVSFDFSETKDTLDATYVRAHGKLEVIGGAAKVGTSDDYGFIANGSAAEIIINGTDITSNGGGIAAANGAKVVFNDGKVYVDTASTAGRYLFYVVGEGSEVEINDGEFSWDPADNQKRAYVYAAAGTKVTINGGTFGEASTRSGYTAGILGDGTVEIKGGTFGFDPSAWVVDGYEAQYDATAKTWTVVAK